MLLTACTDVPPADWIVASASPWQRLVEFGPSGFAAYARLRYLPDPAYEGQSENEAEVDDDWCDRDQLATCLQVRAPELAFVWPADHAWCVASDVDPHWTGIGAART